MSRFRALVRWAVLGVVLIVFLVLFDHYAPLQPAVTAVYGGLVLALVGLVGVVRPLRALGIRRRGVGALLIVAGGTLAAAGLFWPASTLRASGPRQRLDDFLPEYQFYEFHEVDVNAPPERVTRAVEEVSLSDMPAARVLMRIRAMASGRFAAPPPDRRPILKRFATPGSGFLALDANRQGEYVGGMVGRPWARSRPPSVKTPEEFVAFSAPGNVKVAFNMRWSDVGNGRTRLTTETRIAGTDAAARRTFARYWRVIYPGSAIIRRVWLDAIVDRAEVR